MRKKETPGPVQERTQIGPFAPVSPHWSSVGTEDHESRPMPKHAEIIGFDQLLPLLDRAIACLQQWTEFGGNSRLGSIAVLKYLRDMYLKHGDVYPCTYAEISEASRIWTKGRSSYSYYTFVHRMTLINQVFEMIAGNYVPQKPIHDATSKKSGRKARQVAPGVAEAREKGANTIRCAFVADHIVKNLARSIANPVYRFRYWGKPAIPSYNFPQAKRIGPIMSLGDLDLKDPKNVEQWNMARFIEENTDPNEVLYISLYDGTYTLETVARCVEKPYHPKEWILPKFVLFRISSEIFQHLRACGLITEEFEREVLKKLERNVNDIQDKLAQVGMNAEVHLWHRFPHFAGLLKRDVATFHQWGLDLETFPVSIALIGPERYAEQEDFPYELFKADVEDCLNLKPGTLFSAAEDADPKSTE